MDIAKLDQLAIVLVVTALATAPLVFTSSYAIGVLTVALCYGIWAASWDFMSGLTGRENFGHSLFIGAGAYTAGFLNVNFGASPWWSLVAAPLVAVLFSVVIGFPTLRLRGPDSVLAYYYLTLAFLAASAVALRLLANSSWGVILRAIRGDEATCQAAGINV